MYTMLGVWTSRVAGSLRVVTPGNFLGSCPLLWNRVHPQNIMFSTSNKELRQLCECYSIKKRLSVKYFEEILQLYFKIIQTTILRKSDSNCPPNFHVATPLVVAIDSTIYEGGWVCSLIAFMEKGQELEIMKMYGCSKCFRQEL